MTVMDALGLLAGLVLLVALVVAWLGERGR